MENNPDNYRLLAIERRLDKLEQVDTQVLVERITQVDERRKERSADLTRRIDQLEVEFTALRRAIVAAAITIAVSAILTTTTIYLVFQ